MQWPESKSSYMTAKDFQDNATTLTFLSWERKANDDDDSKKKNSKNWKEKLKFQLRYSYPEYAIDQAGDRILDESGNPFRNRNYMPEFPKGYSIVYKFEEGVLECGSLPLFNCFCKVRPESGDKVIILRTGVDKETKWSVKLAKNATQTGKDEFGADDSVPF